MNRLTDRSKEIPLPCADNSVFWARVHEKLARYEDSGLEPEQCAKYAQAEKEGRLLVLPCKVGDTIYEIDLPEYGVIVCKVIWIDYYIGPAAHIQGNEMVAAVSVSVEVIDGHGKGSCYAFEQSDFGKTVFLTREDAEKALEGTKNDER